MTLKSFIWGLMGTMATLPAHADNVARSEALKQAQDFAATRGLTIQTSARQQAKAKMQDDGTALYFFDTEGDNGFIIVSGDDRARTILGYTTAGHYDEGQLPPAMTAWIEGYIEQISFLEDGNSHVLYASDVTTHEPIKPFIATQWNQYNAACYKNRPAGCVAVALAQVMNLYEVPEDLPAIDGYEYRLRDPYTGGICTETVGALPGIKGFDWSALNDTYDTEPGREEPVSLLMSYCGQAMQTRYMTSSAAATEADATLVLRRWGYASAHIVKRDRYSEGGWDDAIYSELSKQRPVIIGATTASGGAHGFICDGYNGGLYHFNWGWKGQGDCYCALSACEPNMPQYKDNGYTQNQEAIVGIFPTDDAAKVYPEFDPIDYDEANNALTIYVSNEDVEPQSFDFGIGYEQIDGQSKGTKVLFKNCSIESFTTMSLTYPASNLQSILPEEGLYRVYPVASATNDEDGLISAYEKNGICAEVEYKDSHVTILATHDKDNSDAIMLPRAANNAPAYNLAGQQASHGYKGIVIKGGKKMLNR